MNCHGCKWLDEVKSQPKGSGYCCRVVRSKTQNKKARYSYMERCELYEQGDFDARYGKEKTIEKRNIPNANKQGHEGRP